MDASGQDVKCLEHSTLKVPYEVLNKRFRGAQKLLDRETAQVSGATSEIEKILSFQNAPSGSDEKKPTKGEVSKLIGVLVDRLHSLKRKACDSIGDEIEAASMIQKRVEHLKSFSGRESESELKKDLTRSDEMSSVLVGQWKRTRLNRMLVDHLLREGMYDTAALLAQNLQIQELTNVDVFSAAREVEESLKRHETNRMVMWCYENKSKLRKIHSTLELEIRVQEFVELVRSSKGIEAVKHARKFLADSQDETHINAVKKCMGLLAFPINKNALPIHPYYHLLSPARWDELIAHFRSDHARLFQLPPTSILGTVVQAGLAALKTPSCYRSSSRSPNCPVCSEPLSSLASPLPFAHTAHSSLVCASSGEVLNEHNPPLLLPSGFVYGTKTIETLGREGGGRVTCPRSGISYGTTEALRVFVM